jgi:DNA-binding beta-propeller fold protein YncE
MPDGKFSRRRFLAVTGGGAAALTLSGCGCGDCGYWFPIEVGIGIGFPIYYSIGAVQLETDAGGTRYALDPLERTAARLGVDGTPVWKTPHDSMGMPAGIAFGSDGRVYVADLGRHEILVLAPDGSVLGRIGRFGTGPGEFSSPCDVLVDARGWLYVCDSNNHRIQVLDADGNFVDAWGAPGSGPGELNGPCAFALDGTGALHVVDAGNRRIVVFDRDGRFARTYAEAGTCEVVQPRDIAIDRAGVRYVVDGVSRVIQAFDAVTESALSHVVPALPDGRPVVPMRASINPAGGLFLLANAL